MFSSELQNVTDMTDIRVKIFASWGKSLGEHTILKNEAFFGGDLHNLCEMSLSKLS